MTKLLFILLIIISFLPLNAQANSNNFIKIDKIKLNTNVVSVNATGTMEQNALLMDNSAINQGSELCSNSNAYIAGHSSPTKRRQKAGRVFANLHKLKRGDIVSTNNCKYEIRSITIITGKANKNGISYRFTSAQANFVKENTFSEGTLTLQTCTRKLGQILVIKAIKL
jgi:LPXTG-site transpeptidase (sortase) family protein